MLVDAIGVCARPDTARLPDVCVLRLVKFYIEFAGIPPFFCCL